jgi:hypothetical protein
LGLKPALLSSGMLGSVMPRRCVKSLRVVVHLISGRLLDLIKGCAVYGDCNFFTA